MEKYFELDSLPEDNKKYLVKLTKPYFTFDEETKCGNFHIIGARLMHLDYATYLRFCRDSLGATIRGKNCRCPYPVFVKNTETLMFVKLLNKRMAYVMSERNTPYDFSRDEVGKLVATPIENLKKD